VTISPDVYAVHLKTVQGPDGPPGAGEQLRDQWRAAVEGPARAAGLPVPKLIMLESHYRRFEEPLLGLVERLQHDNPERVTAVLLPALVKQSWWAYLLHTHRARRMRKALLNSGGPRLVVMTLPVALEPRSVAANLEVELAREVQLGEEKAGAIVERLRADART
jgi:hypothetical protein